MRKIVAGLYVSMDGVVESPEKWHFPYVNEEMDAAVMATLAEADTLLLGRVTYESFAAVWPHQSGAMADQLNNIRKLVVSTTLRTVKWNNSTLISKQVVDELGRMKERPGKNIGITGSITLTRTLLRAGLVNELHLTVHPIVLGAGTRLFDESPGRLPFTLIDSTAFKSGVLNLHYRSAS